MKDKDEFLKQMENLQVPDIDTSLHQHKVKMTIMNAERSAVLGLWLLIIPCYFLFCILMYAYFHSKSVNNWLIGMALKGIFDKWSRIWDAILFVGLPLISIVINTLAITHVQYKKLKPSLGKANELDITVKLRLWNICLILLSLIIVYLFTLSN